MEAAETGWLPGGVATEPGAIEAGALWPAWYEGWDATVPGVEADGAEGAGTPEDITEAAPVGVVPCPPAEDGALEAGGAALPTGVVPAAELLLIGIGTTTGVVLC